MTTLSLPTPATATLPGDLYVTMRVRDLPSPNVICSDPKQVQRIKRSIQRKGYKPAPGENPITIRRRGDEPEVLIDGNHRTEALLRARMLDERVPVRITVKENWWD